MQKNLKLAASLKQKKYRDRENLFVAEGVRSVETALSANAPICFAVFAAENKENELSAAKERKQNLITALAAKKIPLYETSPADFAKIASAKTPAGILAVIERQKHSLDEFNNAQFLLVLDEVRDAGNAGTIIRTADAFAADGVILLDNSVDLWNDKTVRSTMGSIFHLPIAANVAAADFLRFAVVQNMTVALSLPDKTAKPIMDFSFAAPTALVLGSEAFGVSKNFLAQATGKKHLNMAKLYVPMPGRAESLNVAVAAAVMMYERTRNRTNF